jgi:hypothetical protein
MHFDEGCVLTKETAAVMQIPFRAAGTLTALAAGCAVIVATGLARGDDDARLKQLKLLCVQLSGDLTEPGGMAAFQRCLETHDPLGEIRRNNNLAAPTDRPNAVPPAGFGANTRTSIADDIQRFHAEADIVYVLDKTGRLWSGTLDGKNGRVVDQNIAAFQVSDGHLFLLGTDGTLWRAKADGGEKGRVDGTVAAFHAVNAGLIYVMGTDRRLWRELGDAGKRTEVDRSVNDFQPVDGSVVYVLGADGQLWREAGNAQSRTFVASQVVAFQYLPGGNDTTYVQTADGVLWRKKGSDQPERVDQAVAAFQAVDAEIVYVLGNDGRLWREAGGHDQAVLVDRNVLLGIGRAAFEADPTHVYLLGHDHKLWVEKMPAGR